MYVALVTDDFLQELEQFMNFYKKQHLIAIQTDTFTNKRRLFWCMWNDVLTVFNALSVVSSREAARHPSSVEPPSHIPANAAMLLHT